MLIPIEKALLIKLFYTNIELTIKALRKFRLLKKMKQGRDSITKNGLRYFERWFEKTRSLKDYSPMAGRNYHQKSELTE